MKWIFTIIFVGCFCFSIFAVQDEVLEKMGFTRAHQQGLTGKGVNILVIDQPVYDQHPAIKERVTPLSRPGRGSEVNAHGTNVTSVIVGQDPGGDVNGGAPDAYVYSISPPEFLNLEDRLLPGDVSIVSMSGKHPFPIDHPDFERFAIKLNDFLSRNNAIFVVAMGNRGRMIFDRRDGMMDQGLRFAEMLARYPEIGEKMIFVGNVNHTENSLFGSSQERLDTLDVLVQRYGFTLEQFLVAVDLLTEETFQEVYGNIESYYSDGVFDLYQFDTDFEAILNEKMKEQFGFLLDELANNLYDPPLETGGDYGRLLQFVEDLISSVMQLLPDQPYYLAPRSNRPGETFADKTVVAFGMELSVADVIRDSTGLVYTSKLESGTSESTPLVSSAIAIILEKYPDLTPLQAGQLLLDSATSTDHPTIFGRGLLNLDSALR